LYKIKLIITKATRPLLEAAMRQSQQNVTTRVLSHLAWNSMHRLLQ